MLAAGAIRAFFQIADLWCLGRTERATLLAASPSAIDAWSADAESADLTREQIERISHVLGIYGNLLAILGESALADEWMRRPNADLGERPPLERMLAGNVDDLVDVRSHLDAWRLG